MSGLDVLSFEAAYAHAEEHHDECSILLGNGFSIACDPSFDYKRLLDKARFGSPKRSRRVRRLFRSMNSADFELAVRRLEEAASVSELYATPKAALRMRRDAAQIRDSLANALAVVHPARIGDVGDDRLNDCHDFLKPFDHVYTLNYDLLLYWAMLRRDRANFRDGFRRSGSDLVHTRPDDQTVSWLHGALHLHEVLVPGEGALTLKNDWQSQPLIEQLRDELHNGAFPLMVMEGEWQQKQRKINSSPYLTNAQRLLRKAEGALFTYGWAMSDNDSHIRAAIRRSGVRTLYIGLFGDPSKGSNPATVGAANQLSAERSGTRLRLRYFDTSSAPVW